MTDGSEHTPLSLLVKLGSIAVHAEEMLSPAGHHFDRAALDGLLHDPEVEAWLDDMGALVPVRRAAKGGSTPTG